MLSNQHFYYQTVRRNVVTFGTLFKDITLVKYNADNRSEIDRRVVPLTYAGKENYLNRLLNTPDLPATIEMVLPAMSFELTGLAYDPNRKLQSGLQNFAKVSGSNSSVYNQYVGTPWNLNFALNIYIRNIDDGLQIVEQILPYFNPDYTLTMSFIDEMSIVKNIPVILDTVQMDTQYEGAAEDTERRLVWTLNFTMQTYFYGPVYTGGIIKQATANTFYFADNAADQSALVLTTANTPLGGFKLGEVVYQGTSLAQANAIGTVSNWNYKSGQLAVTITQGKFVANANVYGALSSGSVEILSVPKDLQLVKDVETIKPATANITDDFGFVTTITEFPKIT